MAGNTDRDAIEVEWKWTLKLNMLIRERTKDRLDRIDLSGFTTMWYLDGLTVEEAFHKWIDTRYREVYSTN